MRYAVRRSLAVAHAPMCLLACSSLFVLVKIYSVFVDARDAPAFELLYMFASRMHFFSMCCLFQYVFTAKNTYVLKTVSRVLLI